MFFLSVIYLVIDVLLTYTYSRQVLDISITASENHSLFRRRRQLVRTGISFAIIMTIQTQPLSVSHNILICHACIFNLGRNEPCAFCIVCIDWPTKRIPTMSPWNICCQISSRQFVTTQQFLGAPHEEVLYTFASRKIPCQLTVTNFLL